jgi:hypothetical protein
MHDPATYRRYARECQRLAKTMAEENRGTLLEIAEAWLALAEEAERKKSPAGQRSRGAARAAKPLMQRHQTRSGSRGVRVER